MSEKQSKDRPLSSWKEISAYLGCDERTCLRWEKKFGLPIHRVGHSPAKSHVFAYQEELDRWLRGRRQTADDTASPESGPAPAPRFKKRILRAALVVAAAGAAVVLFLGLRKIMSPSDAQPENFRIEGSRLVILDKAGGELWRYDTGLDNLCKDSYYRDRFQFRGIGPDGSRLTPNLLLRDINGDGWNEVLFSLQTQSNFERSAVFCFDRRGRRLWTFDAGRNRTFGSTAYSPAYGVQSVDFLPRGGGARNLVLVLAYQHPEFPSYAAILTPEGKLRGEYWNSGRLSDYVFIDLDGDGRKELILAGTNNEYLKACLIVLDPDNAWGASPQSGEYRAADLPPGTEKYYLLFPRTAVDRLEDLREAFDMIDLFGQDRIMAGTISSKIFFRLNFRMEIEAVIDSDAFWRKYRTYQEEGRLPPRAPDPDSLRRELAAGVLYWDGANWVSTPTMNK
jgi:hypothetical protein